MDSHIFRREISIDYGYRVRTANSATSSLSGHSSKIEAWINAELLDSGEQAGQVLDLDFLKDVLHDQITVPCDGSLILDVHDPLVKTLRPTWSDREVSDTILAVSARGHMTTEGLTGKLYLILDPPTAANLARHFHEKLKQPVLSRSGGRATLLGIKFWETADQWAGYGPSFGSSVETLEWEHML
jgi:6-pyruvoyl-tetrahydropterin synthase